MQAKYFIEDNIYVIGDIIQLKPNGEYSIRHDGKIYKTKAPLFLTQVLDKKGDSIAVSDILFDEISERFITVCYDYNLAYFYLLDNEYNILPLNHIKSKSMVIEIINNNKNPQLGLEYVRTQLFGEELLPDMVNKFQVIITFDPGYLFNRKLNTKLMLLLLGYFITNDSIVCTCAFVGEEQNIRFHIKLNIPTIEYDKVGRLNQIDLFFNMINNYNVCLKINNYYISFKNRYRDKLSLITADKDALNFSVFNKGTISPVISEFESILNYNISTQFYNNKI